MTATSTPAVSPGDVVVRIDGVPVRELFARAEPLQSGATSQWVAFRAMADLKELHGSRVALEVRRHLTGELQSVDVDERGPCYALSSRTRPKIEDVEAGIFYLDMDRVTGGDFSAVLPQLANATGIVFDFRGYPKITPDNFFSHLSSSLLTSAQWHIPVITRPNHQGVTFQRGAEWSIRPRSRFLSAKKAFLINGVAISYAESCLGIVEY